MGIVLGYTYVYQVSIPYVSKRLILIEQVLKGEAKADYVFGMYSLANVHNYLVSIMGNPLFALSIVDFLGIILLFQCAYYFLTRLFQNQFSRIMALLYLLVTTPLLFRQHYYHPSDFYGVSLMFFILISVREKRCILLALLCLISGMLWEKALFVPLVFLIYVARDYGIRKGLLYSLPALLATLFYFITWRVMFPNVQRFAILTWPQLLHRLPRDLFEWGVWTVPLIVILLDILINRRKIDSFWILWLFYAPLLICGLIIMTHFWGELRTFWILQPIFVGLVACWMENNIHWNRQI
jgi:hypothetical protein